MTHQGTRIQRSLDLFFHSIRFRLVLWFVLILGVIMAAFSGFIYYRQAQDLRSFALGHLNLKLESLLGAQNESDQGFENSQAGIALSGGNSQTAGGNSQDGDVVALMAADGTVVQSLGALTSAQIQSLNLPQVGWQGVQDVTAPEIPLIQSRHYLFISRPVHESGVVLGYLLVGVPYDANNQLGRLLISLVIGNLLTLAIALSGGFWLADRAMRPVHTITRTARQISESDLHRRLHLPGKDELAELAGTFDEMLDRLQAAFERQRQFTADASHELRTPLTIIDLETSRGLTSRRSVEEYERILGTIQSENKTMIHLVTSLLALARMDAGQVKLKSEPLDLGDLVSEVIERMEPLANARGVELAIGSLPELTIRGDQPALVQMLSNLMENAIKYSAPVPHPRVSVSAGRFQEGGNGFAWVRVGDNGPGIPAEHLEHIFDRFYQVDASRTRMEANAPGEEPSSGAGLGLAIAQWIARAHQGEIRVTSRAGEGSTFEVRLPLAKEEKINHEGR